MTTGRINQNGSAPNQKSKNIKNKEKQTKGTKNQSKTRKNNQKQANTCKTKQQQERGFRMAESLRQAYDYWQDQPE
jgi:uncharacterized protein (DUF2384 family)